ncbi:MAG: PDZ domain-containing protein [Acidobacteriota bacterium]
MNTRGFAVVVGFVVVAGFLAMGSSASAGWFGQGDRTIDLRHGAGSVEVQLVPDRGKALNLKPRGPHRWVFDGATEALVGGSYSIKLRNSSSERIKVVVGVDGLNVYGKERIVGRADGDTGSILSPGETRVLKGWQMDHSTAQRFVFSPPEWSEGRGRTDSRIGLIVVQVYRERRREWFGLQDNRAEECAPEAGRRLQRKAVPRAQIGTTSGDDVSSRVRTVHFESLTTYPEAWAEVDYGRYPVPPPRPRPAILGVTVFTCEMGSRIDGVVPGSIADEAGLKLDDIIVRVDTEDRPSAQRLSEILRSKRPGDFVFLKVQRGRHELSLKIRL